MSPGLDLLRIENSDYPLRMSPAPFMEIGNIKLMEYFSWCSGAAGYIASRRAATRIVQGEEILFTQTDRALFNPFEKIARDLGMFQTVPALCKQIDTTMLRNAADADSNIARARAGRAEIERKLFPQRIFNDVREFLDRDVRVASIKLWKQITNGTYKQEVPFKSE